MPSGTHSRKLRAAALTPARSRRTSPRVLVATLAITVCAVGAILLINAIRGKSDSGAASSTPAIGSLTNAIPGAAEIEALFKGIPQHGAVLGSATAPVTVEEYVDVQCPYCAIAENAVLPTIVRAYVRTGRVRIVLRTWAFIGPDSTRGQAAVLAAGAQNRAFNALALLYANQGTENTGWLSDAMITNVAASIPGLGVNRLLDERNSMSVKAAAATINAIAHTNGIRSTPTFVVGKTGVTGSPVALQGPTDVKSLERAIATIG